VVGYARLSPRPEEGFGLEVQAEKMRSYAQLYDLDLVEIVTEPGLISGKSLDRPGLQKALSMLRSGQVGGLLVAKLDRLSRNVIDMGMLIEDYFAKDYGLYCVAEQVNTKTAAGRMVLNILTVIAQWERETIGERTSEALQHLVKQGVDVGRAPFGYEYTDALDEHGRRVVREVQDEQDALGVMRFYRGRGHTLSDIAAKLNADGYKTKRGGEWHAGTISKILRRDPRKKRKKQKKRRKA
jgi:DNA invertase Pin-like site-specific DNA recombinase